MDLQAIWEWLIEPQNQTTLAWLGGGAAAVAGGGWAVVKVLLRRDPSVTAKGGGVAVGRDMTGSTVTTHPPTGKADDPAPPPDTKG